MDGQDDERFEEDQQQRQRGYNDAGDGNEGAEDEEEVALLLSTFDRCRPRADGTVDVRCVWACSGGGDDGADEQASHHTSHPW